jgi:hypothetical protein
MGEEKNLTEELKELPANQPVKLRNLTCVYCGVVLSNVNSNEEHVIARNFVPKGKLDKQWNLIVRTCEVCNNKKSDLEDDISAITMQPDLHGLHVVHDENLASDSIRKSKSSSRRTGKPVLESKEELTLNAPFFGGNIAFGLRSPPQIDQERAFELAHYHITAFFYWLTYDETTKMGNVWDGVYFPVQVTSKKDWGSNLNQAFMKLVSDWQLKLHRETADGFFKLIIRKQPESECGSWALEWNKNYRVIGFFGNKESMEEFDALLPNPEVKNIPLTDENDSLFKFNI